MPDAVLAESVPARLLFSAHTVSARRSLAVHCPKFGPGMTPAVRVTRRADHRPDPGTCRRSRANWKGFMPARRAKIATASVAWTTARKSRAGRAPTPISSSSRRPVRDHIERRSLDLPACAAVWMNRLLLDLGFAESGVHPCRRPRRRRTLISATSSGIKSWPAPPVDALRVRAGEARQHVDIDTVRSRRRARQRACDLQHPALYDRRPPSCSARRG